MLEPVCRLEYRECRIVLTRTVKRCPEGKPGADTLRHRDRRVVERRAQPLHLGRIAGVLADHDQIAPRFHQIGIEFERLEVTGLGFRELPGRGQVGAEEYPKVRLCGRQFQRTPARNHGCSRVEAPALGHSQGCMGIDIVRRQRHGLLMPVACFVQAPQADQCNAKIDHAVGTIRTQPVGHRKGLDGGWQVAQAQQPEAQLRPGIREIRGEHRGLAKRCHRGAVVAEVQTSMSELQVRFGKVRIEGDGPFCRVGRTCRLPDETLHPGEIGQRLGKVRVDFECPLDQRDGLLRVAAALHDQAKQIERIRVIRALP